MEFSRQKYLSGLPFPSPGDLPSSGSEPRSPALQEDYLPFEPPGKPLYLSLFLSLSHRFSVSVCHSLSIKYMKFSCSVVSDSLGPYELHHTRLPVRHQLSELAHTHVH